MVWGGGWASAWGGWAGEDQKRGRDIAVTQEMMRHTWGTGIMGVTSLSFAAEGNGRNQAQVKKPSTRPLWGDATDGELYDSGAGTSES